MSLLICYDGSAGAEAAIAAAGGLFGDGDATVLTVWEGFADVVTRTGAGLAVVTVDFESIDQASEQAAGERAQQGADHAREAGLNAQPRVAKRGATIWGTILEQADETGAAALVLGRRGLTGLQSILLGSVSHAVLVHADRPVLVVPSS